MNNSVSVTFLGGLGDIGRNCAAIESQDQILILDCGQLFPDEMMPGAHSVLPDFSYLNTRAEKIVGCIATHAHEDHIGALTYALQIANFPIYGSPFTLGMIRHRLNEANLMGKTELIPIEDGDIVNIGDFQCEFLPVTHSIPRGLISAIHTPQGMILHSSDFKLDLNPIDGRHTDLERIIELSKDPGVRLLLCDSTNAEIPGSSISESTVGRELKKVFEDNKDKRVITACFSSHIHRVQQIADIAVNQGRKIATLGFSMRRNVGLARELGILSLSESNLIDISEVGTYPPDEICIVSTGSQAEPRSSLSLAAKGDGRWLEIGSNDVVILSSRSIPGNEKRIGKMINSLGRRGAVVISADFQDIHTSGHGQQDELTALHDAVNPEWLVPVHGEYRHLTAHKDLAIRNGMPPNRVLVAVDGDQVTLDDKGLVLREKVCEGAYIFSQGSITERSHNIFSERLILGEEGCVIASITVDLQNREILETPTVVSKGWLNAETARGFEEEIEELLIQEIEHLLDREKKISKDLVMQRVRRSTGGFVNEQTKRRPMIIPIVTLA
ncbi:MAG: ribonuclease J [Acidimicrobiales bacterium]|jgi:ribonuclease J|nr:ribonuclease J [Acidimicrobiales bacterium]MDP6298536.1 ribonuclease J [Acidimicrobiales bacterium]HJM27606.1 ribonuclease J [Acidimicrobiales bacterium]HJM98514.1 ribonuclease J [Acidimicrobiales bacterium]